MTSKERILAMLDLKARDVQTVHAPRSIKAGAVLDRVAKVYGVQATDLKSKSRQHHVAQARHAACYWLREFGYSTIAIGHLLNRDHTTVITSSRKAIELARYNARYRKNLKACDWEAWGE